MITNRYIFSTSIRKINWVTFVLKIKHIFLVLWTLELVFKFFHAFFIYNFGEKEL